MPIISAELKQSKEFTWLLVLIIIISIILYYAFIGTLLSSNIFKDNVKYEITGKADYVNIALTDQNGNVEKRINVKLPFVYEMEKDGFAYIAAESQDASIITARIYKNDKMILSSTGSSVKVTSND